MTPADAGKILAEPDWLDLWDRLKVADDGFEAILRKWREWHFSPAADGKKKLAPSIDGLVALANLGIMPLRNHTEGQGTLFEEQHDDHCHLITEGRSWRILGIEDKTLFLNAFGEERQIDLSKAKWTQYTAMWARVLAQGDSNG